MTKIITLTISTTERDVLAALKAGARAYAVKRTATREFVNILHAVWAGESYVSPTLATHLLAEMTSPLPEGQPEIGPFDGLTERERQILELIGSGRSNREIGQQLGLAENTVKHYITNILQKLHVRSRVEAALLARTGERTERKTS